MTCLTYALEEGIEVYSYELVHMNATMECDKDVTVLDASITSSAVPANEASGIGTMKLIKRKCMLWIDVDPNEPGLSRVCLVNKTNLKAYKQQQSRGQMPYHCNRRSSSGDVAWYNRKSSLDGNSKRDEFGGNGVDQYAPEEAKLLNDEDERFSKGLYMSDIAEVRIGCNSFVFRYAAAISMVSSVDSNATAPNPLPFDSSQCFSIVGSERTMEIELVDTHYPPSITKNTNVMKRLGGNKKTLPVLSFRDYITDFMNLSVIHSLQLYEQEDVLRNKKW